MTYLIGIDLGTSSIKAAVVAVQTRRILAVAAREYPIQHPQPLAAEQSPDDWWGATILTVREVFSDSGIDPTDVCGIGIDGQMHGTVCLDANANPVRPAVIWADGRAQAEAVNAARIARDMDGLCGRPAVGFMVTTLMWLTTHEPDTLRHTQTVIPPKDYLRLKLTGTIGTDISDAAATGLLDVRTGTWSQIMIDGCGLETRYLPTIDPSATVIGELTTHAAESLGLSEGLPVIAGCADLPAQALGYGLFEMGTALVTVGTGGQVFMPMDTPVFDAQGRYYTFNHAVPDGWYAQAAILSAGLSLRWLRDTLGLSDRPDAYDYLSSLASDVPPGADGLTFLPYLAGERTPHHDPQAKGAFIGLRLHHGAGHLVRAVMEGVAFALADCLALLPDVDRLILSGGATNSPIWTQILTDVFNRPLALTETSHPACVGAALLAGVGTGQYATIADACAGLPRPNRHVMPSNAANDYADRLARFRQLYPLLKPDMHALS